MTGGIKAGRAFVELFADSNKLYRALDLAERRVKQFAATAGRIGLGVAGAGAAILAPLGAIFTDTIGNFDKFNDAADRIGTSTEVFSQLVHGAEMSGAAFGDVETAAIKMRKAIAGDDAAFKQLGIDAQKLRGMSLDGQFGQIADALQRVDDEAKIDLATSIFGKGGAALIPMLANGSKGLAEFAAEADRLGKTIDGVDAAKGARVADAFDKAWAATKATIREVGAALLDIVGPIEDVTEGVVTLTRDLREWIKDNRQLILTITGVAAAMVAGGVALAGTAAAISVVATIAGGAIVVLKALAATVLFLTSPLGLVLAAVLAVAGGLVYLYSKTEHASQMLGDLKASFADAAEFIKGAWKGVGDAVSAGDWSLAFAIGLKAAEVAWLAFVQKLTAGWVDFKGYFIDIWQDATGFLAKAFSGMIAGVEIVFTTFLRNLIGPFNEIAGALDLPKIDLGLRTDDQIKNELKAITDGIDKITEAEKKRSKAFGEGQKAGAKAALDAAKAELEVLKEQAAEEAARARIRKGGLGAILGGVGGAGMAEKSLPSVMQISAISKGTFGGNITGQLGYGDTVAQDTLGAAKKTATNSDKQVKLLEKIAGEEMAVWE